MSNIHFILAEKRRKRKNFNEILIVLQYVVLAVKKIACYNISDIGKSFMTLKIEVSPAEIVG
jgi:hypothetical protein